jgi:peptidyl-prolyl cis-trans isomerase SurA
MFKKLLFAALAVLVLAVTGRAGDNTIVDEIIARVDNSIITRADYVRAEQTAMEETQQQFPGNWQARWAERQKETLRGLIDQQLLLDKGKELGITGETQVVKRLNEMRVKMGKASMDELEEEARKQGINWEEFKEQIRSGVVAEQVIGQEVGSKVQRSITTDEALAWYNKHQKDMEGPEQVSLNEILVKVQQPPASSENKDTAGGTVAPAQDDPARAAEAAAKVAEAKAKANSILEQLRKGAKFEDLAKSSSDGETAAEGGRLGEFKRGELVKDYEDRTFSLKPGEYTDVIQTKQGFIILRVNAHRAAGVPAFKDVEDRIKEAVYAEKLEPAARDYLTKLRDEAFIDIKQGYVDTGASPNNQANKPVMVAAAGSAPATTSKTHAKKKKKLGIF